MRKNRTTFSYDDRTKAILQHNIQKFGISKSDLIDYLINYSRYPKYSKSEVREQHQTNIELERINTKLNTIQLDYHGECNLLDQIVHDINFLRKYPKYNPKYWITNLMDLLKRSREGSNEIPKLSKDLREEVNNHGVR